MDTGCYRFMVGNIECFAVSDGTGVYENPPRVLFENAPREELRQALVKHDIQLDTWSEWVSSFNCLLIRSGGQRILMDTGNGSLELRPEAGRLLQNLEAAGLRAGEIDTVILTHGHGDHIGGVTDAEGRVVFGNARHVMWRTEWEFWNSEAGREESDAHLKLAALGDRLDLIDQETGIAPGVHILAAAGHTPGHVVVSVVSEEEQFIHLIDTVAHPLSLERPDWNMLFDFEYEPATQTRRRLLGKVSDGKTLVMGYHFDFPGLGYVRRKGDAWEWEPAVTA